MNKKKVYQKLFPSNKIFNEAFSILEKLIFDIPLCPISIFAKFRKSPTGIYEITRSGSRNPGRENSQRSSHRFEIKSHIGKLIFPCGENATNAFFFHIVAYTIDR